MAYSDGTIDINLGEYTETRTGTATVTLKDTVTTRANPFGHTAPLGYWEDPELNPTHGGAWVHYDDDPDHTWQHWGGGMWGEYPFGMGDAWWDYPNEFNRSCNYWQTGHQDHWFEIQTYTQNDVNDVPTQKSRMGRAKLSVANLGSLEILFGDVGEDIDPYIWLDSQGNAVNPWMLGLPASAYSTDINTNRVRVYACFNYYDAMLPYSPQNTFGHSFGFGGDDADGYAYHDLKDSSPGTCSLRQYLFQYDTNTWTGYSSRGAYNSDFTITYTVEMVFEKHIVLKEKDYRLYVDLHSSYTHDGDPYGMPGQEVEVYYIPLRYKQTYNCNGAVRVSEHDVEQTEWNLARWRHGLGKIDMYMSQTPENIMWNEIEDAPVEAGSCTLLVNGAKHSCPADISRSPYDDPLSVGKVSSTGEFTLTGMSIIPECYYSSTLPAFKVRSYVAVSNMDGQAVDVAVNLGYSPSGSSDGVTGTANSTDPDEFAVQCYGEWSMGWQFGQYPTQDPQYSYIWYQDVIGNGDPNSQNWCVIPIMGSGILESEFEANDIPHFNTKGYPMGARQWQNYSDSKVEASVGDLSAEGYNISMTADPTTIIDFDTIAPASSWTCSSGVTASITSGKLRLVVASDAVAPAASNTFNNKTFIGRRFLKMNYTSTDAEDLPIKLSIAGREWATKKTTAGLDVIAPDNKVIGTLTSQSAWQVDNPTWDWSLRTCGELIISNLQPGKTYDFDTIQLIRHPDPAKRMMSVDIHAPFVGAHPGDRESQDNYSLFYNDYSPECGNGASSNQLYSRIGVVYLDGCPCWELFGVRHDKVWYYDRTYGTQLGWRHLPIAMSETKQTITTQPEGQTNYTYGWSYPDIATIPGASFSKTVETNPDRAAVFTLDREACWLAPGRYTGENTLSLNWCPTATMFTLPYGEVAKRSYSIKKTLQGQIRLRVFNNDGSEYNGQVTLYKYDRAASGVLQNSSSVSVVNGWADLPSLPQYTQDQGTITAVNSTTSLTVSGLSKNYTGYTFWVRQYIANTYYAPISRTIMTHNTTTGVITFAAIPANSVAVGNEIGVQLEHHYKITVGGQTADLVLFNRNITLAQITVNMGKGILYKGSAAGQPILFKASATGQPILYVD